MSAIQQVLLAYGSSSAVTDPLYAYVQSLLHFNGTSGSTTFTDQKSLTWSSNGDAALTTTTYKFGTAGLHSSTGGVFTTTNAPALGTGDFTVEFWINCASILAGGVILFDNRSASATGNPAVYTSNGALIYYAGANRITGPTLVASTWYHIALSRVSGNSRLFVNGSQVGSTYADSGNYAAAPLTLMEQYNLVGPSNGYMDDFRFTVGAGRYTSNFTPPTAQFPDS